MTSRQRHIICIVPCCKIKSEHSNLKFFKFPSDETKKLKWIKSIGLVETDIKNKQNFICEKHFRKEFIGRQYLTKNAIPDINLDINVNDEVQEARSVTEEWEDIEVLNEPQFSRESKNTQTDPIDQDSDFLRLINEINCFHCENTENNLNFDKNCTKCTKLGKDILIHKQKLKAAKTKIQILRTKCHKFKRNYTILKTKFTRLKNVSVDEYIKQLTSVNDMSRNVCRLLLKEDYYYNENDKNFAQCLYYKSATTYKYLKDTLGLRLPSLSSIYKWSSIKYISPGTNNVLFKQLKHLFDDMPESSRICVLSFDDVVIKKDLTVNLLTDRVEGFYDTGCKRSSDLASSALFFMLRGLVGNWKHVLNYVLINNCFKPEELSALIIENIKLCQTVFNLNVVMLTCDQATSNVAAYKCLGVSAQQPYIVVNEQKIFMQYDPPHLIKSVRNALIKYQISHTDYGTLDFNVIKQIYEHDNSNNVKLLPKLTKNHIEPNAFQKMNVKLAVQIVSYTVACAIRTTLKTQPSIFGKYLDNAIPTANIVEQFNNIFDCLNCRNFSSKYLYQQPLRRDNHIYVYLEKSLIFLQNLKIISVNENYFKFLKGLELTINAQLRLIDHLSATYGTEYILTGKSNQDALENFFSALRGKGGYNYTPSSHEIGVHYANIIVMKILFKSINSNC